MGSKVNLGSFGVIEVKFWFSLKMYYLFYITKYVHVIHTLASHLRDNRETGVSQGSMSQSRQGTPSVTATCLVLSFFLLQATRLFHILPDIWFWPNLVTVTDTWTTTHVQTIMGSEVTMGSQGSKGHFHQKGIKSYRMRSIDAWFMHMH